MSEPQLAQLSPHFSLEELTFSQTAARRRIDNTPPPSILANLRATASHMERVRLLLGGRPISVSSGYRSKALNKAIGGSPTSAHMTGHAVDFTCRAFGSPLAICRAIAGSDLQFDQLIEEMGRWVHISFAPSMRREVLTYRDGSYTRGLRI